MTKGKFRRQGTRYGPKAISFWHSAKGPLAENRLPPVATCGMEKTAKSQNTVIREESE